MTAPERIANVLGSYFSVARHYGGCEAFGAQYVYDATTDTLIRVDVAQRERIGTRKLRAAQLASWQAPQLSFMPIDREENTDEEAFDDDH